MEDGLKIKEYKMQSEVTYVRKFLGKDIAFVPIEQVLIFKVGNNYCWGNPFMQEVMKSIAYNQIKIVAYGDGSFGYTKEEYKKLLEQLGFSMIHQIVMAQDFHKKTCGYDFFQKMIGMYKNEYKYAIICKEVNLYAMKHHIELIVYTPPDLYQKRYYFGNRLSSILEAEINYSNQKLFHGLIKETRDFHFGYIFAGIFLYHFLVYVHQKHMEREAETLYFTVTSMDICEVYSMLYPEDQARIMYLDTASMNQGNWNQEGKEERIVDFSFRDEVNDQQIVTTLSSFFSKETKENYQQKIEEIVDCMYAFPYEIEQFVEGKPYWKQRDCKNKSWQERREIQRGLREHCKDFAAILPKINIEDTETSDMKTEIAQIITYGFMDFIRRPKPKESLLQRISRSEKIKKIYNKIRNILKR